MSTSQYRAHIRFDTAQLSDHDPVDTDLARTLRNNALHAADTHGSTLAEWVTVQSTGPNYSGAANEFVLVYYSPSVLLRRNANGTPYPWRVHLAGSVSSGTVSFRIVATCGNNSTRWLQDALANDDACATGSTSSATAAWLALDKTLIQMPSERFHARDTRIHRGDVAVPYGRVAVFATHTGGWSNAFLRGVYAAEYCGV
ncbi:MAG: hypothetical protein IT379_23570 [Deltaproteobacteria bacterium]|nr:hypothetical protein [Deltaproteobacteria bacterium]